VKPKVMKVKAGDGQEIDVCEVRADESGELWPVCVTEGGEERPFNTLDAFGKLKRYPEEKTLLQRRADQAEQSLSALAALGDVDTLRAAVEVQKNLTAGKLIAAGDAQKVRDDAVREAQAQIQSLQAELSSARSETDRLAIGHTFHSSGLFVKDDKGSAKIRLKPSAIQALYGHHFRRETDGTIAAYDGESRVMSHVNIGDPASFDEALSILINKSIHKDDVWAGTAANGSGAANGGRGGSGDGKSMARKQFEALNTADKNKFLAGGGVLTA
jgi:hypothetical protein